MQLDNDKKLYLKGLDLLLTSMVILYLVLSKGRGWFWNFLGAPLICR